MEKKIWKRIFVSEIIVYELETLNSFYKKRIDFISSQSVNIQSQDFPNP